MKPKRKPVPQRRPRSASNDAHADDRMDDEGKPRRRRPGRMKGDRSDPGGDIDLSDRMMARAKKSGAMLDTSKVGRRRQGPWEDRLYDK